MALDGIRVRLAWCPRLSRTVNSIDLFPIETAQLQVRLWWPVLTPENSPTQGPQREMFTSECRFGGSSKISFHETLHQTGRRLRGGKSGGGGGGRVSCLKKTFEVGVLSRALHLSTFFPFHLETLFISQSIKTMCF